MVSAQPTLRLVVVAAALLPSTRGVTAAADPKPVDAKPADVQATRDPKEAKKEPQEAKKEKEPQEKSGRERPACMHCGATCGLVPVCVCKPGTRKTQKTEYEATCDPLCVPCCSGPPWARHRPAAGCTACEAACPDAWVRQRKKLVKETKDEETPMIERKVAWVCRGCVPGGPLTCTGDADAIPRQAGWWPTWLPHLRATASMGGTAGSHR